MKNTFRISTLLLVAPLLMAAGCSGSSETPTPAVQTPPVEETQPTTMTPPEGESMEGMDHSSSSMPGMGGMKQPGTEPELSDLQKTELAAGEASKGGSELTFHVSGGSFFYVPNMIKVKKGDKVKIVFENVGGMHNFMLDEFNVKMDPIQTGENTTVEFTADKAGSFQYYCSVGQHRKMGQQGTIVVEE